jgi:hypothetical protein
MNQSGVIQFGSGIVIARPLSQSGSSLAPVPSPKQAAELQNVSFDIKGDLKELYSLYQYPDDVAVGKKKITGKAQLGALDLMLLNQIFAANAVAAGIVDVQWNEAHTVPTSSSYNVVVTNSTHFLNDYGVVYAATGLPLLPTTGSPTQGQYSVSGGTYTFSSADASAAVLISYTWTNSTTGSTYTLSQQLMGTSPTFDLVVIAPYQATYASIHFLNCKCSSISFATKLDDFAMMNMEFGVFATAGGQVVNIYAQQ